jgi:hypothetical protein
MTMAAKKAKKQAAVKAVTEAAETPPVKTKQIRIRLTYIVTVAEDFPVHTMGRNIDSLIARGVLAFVRNDDESVIIEGGSRLQLSAVGRKGRL